MARLVPVNYDPFKQNEEEQQAPARKLVPVDYDPFSTSEPEGSRSAIPMPTEENSPMSNPPLKRAFDYLMEQGVKPRSERDWWGNVAAGHIPDDLKVPEGESDSPALYAVKQTAGDMLNTAVRALPEALAWSLPALMTAGAAPVVGLTGKATQGVAPQIMNTVTEQFGGRMPQLIEGATALEKAVAAAPTASRTLMTGLATGVKEGTGSALEGNSLGEVIDDAGRGALTGTALDYGGEKVIHGVGKGVGLVREYLPKAMRLIGSGFSDDVARTRAGQILQDTSDNLQLDKVDDAINRATTVENTINGSLGPHDSKVRFNSAEVLDDAHGIVSLNQKLNRADSKAVEKAVEHRGKLNTGVTRLVEQGAGAKGAGTLDDTVTATRQGLDDFNNGLQSQENALHQDFMRNVGDSPSLDVSGATGRQALDNQRRGVKLNTVNPAYDDVADVQVDTSGLQRKFNDIMRPTSRGENPENIPTSFIARARQAMTQGVDNGVSADLATLRDLEKEARQLKVNARNAQGNANQSIARRYQQIEDAIRDTIDNGAVASDSGPMLASALDNEASALLSSTSDNVVIDGYVKNAKVSDAPEWFLEMNRRLPDENKISKQAAANALKRAAAGKSKGALDEMVLDAAMPSIERGALSSTRRVATGNLDVGDTFTAIHPQTGEMAQARVVGAENGKKIVQFGKADDGLDLTGNRIELDDTFDTVEMIGGKSVNNLPGEAQKLRQANAAFKDYSETYKEGSVGQVLRKSGYEYRIPDSKVIGKFFPKGDAGAETAAAQFRRAARGDQTAWQALEDGVIRDMVDTVAPTGVVEPGKYAAWYRQHKTALQQYPELRKRIGNVQRAQGALDEFWSRAKELREQTETATLKKFLGSDADRAINRVLDSQNPVKEIENLLNLVGDNQHAKNGIKREVMGYLKGKIATTAKIDGQYVISGAGMKKNFDKLKPTLQKIYSPSEMRDLEVAIQAEEMMKRAWNPQLSGSPTAEWMKDGIDKTAAAGRAASGFFANSAFVVVDGLFKLARGAAHGIGIDKTRQVLLQAMDDPRVLRELIAAAQGTRPESKMVSVLEKYGLDEFLMAVGRTGGAEVKASAHEEMNR